MSRRLTYVLTAVFFGLLILGYLLFWPSPVNKKQGPIDSPKAATADAAAQNQIATATPVTTGDGDELAVPTGVSLGDDAPRKVVIRVLDKITQRMREYELDMDQSVRFGVIDVRVRTCIATPPHEKPESSAFLQIDEQRAGRPRNRIYSGWMFASSPSLNPLQHPIYDVWVIKCKMSFPDKGPDTIEVSAVTDEEKRGTGDALDDATGVVRKKSPKKPANKPASADAAATPAPAPEPAPAPAPAPAPEE
jgi:hypothetical protein